MSLYDNQQAPVDPYAEQYNSAPAAMDTTDNPAPPRRSRSRSPRDNGESFERDGPSSERDGRRGSPPPKRSSHAPQGKAPDPSSVLGVFGLSIRTQERDLDEEFSRFGRVEKVTIVYDQRSDRSRGFGFIRMSTVEEATKCIEELNGVELHGRRLRVDYSVTNKPHAPTPGEYMGHRRGRDRDYDRRDSRRDRDRDHYRDDFRERGGPRERDYERRDRDYDRDRRRDRDPYGRDRDDWRRRSPPRGGRGYSPDYSRRRRSYSRSPPRGSSPRREEAPAEDRRW